VKLSMPHRRPPATAELGVAPQLDTAGGWLHGVEATTADAVVLYEIWTFGCINCVRTLPYVRALWARYRVDGLVVVGIHTPEFAHEADVDKVAAASARLGVTWPVLLDPHRVNWNRFQNRYWPHVFITDRTGAIRFDHIGEGAYAAMEDSVRSLLGVAAASSRAAFPG